MQNQRWGPALFFQQPDKGLFLETYLLAVTFQEQSGDQKNGYPEKARLPTTATKALTNCTKIAKFPAYCPSQIHTGATAFAVAKKVVSSFPISKSHLAKSKEKLKDP